MVRTCKHYRFYRGVRYYPDMSGEPDHEECEKEHNWCWRGDPFACPNRNSKQVYCYACGGSGMYYGWTSYPQSEENRQKRKCLQCVGTGKHPPACHCDLCIENNEESTHHECGESCPDYEPVLLKEDFYP